MNRVFYSSLFLLCALLTSVPRAEAQSGGYVVGYLVENMDTVYYIRMRELPVYGWKKSTRSNRDWQEYIRLVYNFKKTYPYALIAKEKIHIADSVLYNARMSKRDEDRYLKQFETQLFKEFEKPLRGMTFSQGRLLMKLIDREIGQSSYYIIRNYRGGVTAGFWQGVAKIFGADLKKPYDRFGEDRQTEEFVRMYHEGTFDYLYYSIF